MSAPLYICAEQLLASDEQCEISKSCTRETTENWRYVLLLCRTLWCLLLADKWMSSVVLTSSVGWSDPGVQKPCDW